MYSYAPSCTLKLSASCGGTCSVRCYKQHFVHVGNSLTSMRVFFKITMFMPNFSVKYAKKVVKYGFQPSYAAKISKNPPTCREFSVQKTPISSLMPPPPELTQYKSRCQLSFKFITFLCSAIFIET